MSRVDSKNRSNCTRCCNRESLQNCDLRDSRTSALSKGYEVEEEEEERTDFVSYDLPLVASDDRHSRPTRRLSTLTRRRDPTQLSQPSDSN